MTPGHRRRMHRLIPPGRPALWLPVDDALISGPETGLRDVRTLLNPAVTRNINAVLGFRGTLTHAADTLTGTATILNLTASTEGPHHLNKVRAGHVEDAVRLGADAVAVHLNLTSPHEPAQLTLLAEVVAEADRYAMPVVAFAYPRTHRDGTEETSTDGTLIRHCVRIAVELGASAVKTIYPDSHMSAVVQAAMGVPVLAAGGAPPTWPTLPPDDDRTLLQACQAIESGFAGVAYGRRIFTNPNPAAFTDRLRRSLNAGSPQP